MPSLARGQENTPSIVNWFTTVNGILTDMYKIEFQIWNITAGLPGNVIFPVSGDANSWEDVTTGGGHYSVGHYFAYDNSQSKGYTPDLGQPLGTHRIKWRWKASGSAPYQSGAEDFEVIVQSAGGSDDTYISVQDLRDAGVSSSVISDADALEMIKVWQDFLDRACRQWFNSRTLEFEVDGNDSDTLHLGIPIINLDYLQINGSGENLDPSYFKVYSSEDPGQDNRRNPRICLIRSDSNMSIFTAPDSFNNLRFRKGRKNQKIKGTFGFVERDGSTSRLIKRALLKLVIEKIKSPLYNDSSGTQIAPPVLGVVLKEKTDGHSIEYGFQNDGSIEFEKRRSGLSGITQDAEILDIIKLYKAPIGVATPAGWSYE